MALDLRDYSVARIGSIWTKEDHQFLLLSLERIDQTCVNVWAQIRREARGEPKRLDELLGLGEPESRLDTNTLDLPFDQQETSDG
jgi:hypothetical protein